MKRSQGVRYGSFLLLMVLLTSARTVVAAARPKPLGRLIDVGGYRVHLYCTGVGQPAVIITGAGYSFDWALVQPEIARHTEVCSYDHSGVGWSDPGPPDSCELRVKELHSALAGAGVAGPYILVGHSLGALVTRLYAFTYPGEVAGVVFVDHAVPAAPQTKRLPEPPGPLFGTASPSSAVTETPSLSSDAASELDSEWQKLPPRDLALHQWADSLPNHGSVMARNSSLVTECSAEAATLGMDRAAALADKPLVVLSTVANASTATQLATLSTNGISVVVPNSTHFIMVDQPQAVIEAVLHVLSDVRRRTSR